MFKFEKDASPNSHGLDLELGICVSRNKDEKIRWNRTPKEIGMERNTTGINIVNKMKSSRDMIILVET